MRTLALTLGVAVFAFVGGIVFLWPAHGVGSEPINYGRDACAHCRMHISQPGFGGEMRDRTGVITKYDDVGCLLHAMIALHENIPETWVEDHAGGGFVPLLTAHLVRTSAGDTPMGSGIVAFGDAVAASAFAQAHNGELVQLEDIVRDPAQLAAGNKNAAHTADKVER
jgi:copper chaperone NosL